MEPLVIDDFIPEIYQDSIYHLLTGSEFPWIFHDYSVNEEYGEFNNLYQMNEIYKEHVQMRHVFVRDDEIKSQYFQYIAPLLGEYVKHSGSNIKGIFRIKSNLLVAQPGIQTQLAHADGMNVVDGQITSIGKKTLLYYVNDSDGDTFFYNKYYDGNPLGTIEKTISVTPKKGRAVIFDSNHLHGGSCPKDSKFRMVINCVFNG
jgi:hypothetical protein